MSNVSTNANITINGAGGLIKGTYDGIYDYGTETTTLTLNDVVVRGTAADSKGMYLIGAKHVDGHGNSKLIANNVTFIGLKAGLNYEEVEYCKAELENCQFYGGTAGISGTFNDKSGLNNLNALIKSKSNNHWYDGNNQKISDSITKGNDGSAMGKCVYLHNDGETACGGAVSVYGTFTMNGGCIMDCEAEQSGGAVWTGESGTFVMNSGTITRCKGGTGASISSDGTCILNGGSIGGKKDNGGDKSCEIYIRPDKAGKVTLNNTYITKEGTYHVCNDGNANSCVTIANAKPSAMPHCIFAQQTA